MSYRSRHKRQFPDEECRAARAAVWLYGNVNDVGTKQCRSPISDAADYVARLTATLDCLLKVSRQQISMINP